MGYQPLAIRITQNNKRLCYGLARANLADFWLGSAYRYAKSNINQVRQSFFLKFHILFKISLSKFIVGTKSTYFSSYSTRRRRGSDDTLSLSWFVSASFPVIISPTIIFSNPPCPLMWRKYFIFSA